MSQNSELIVEFNKSKWLVISSSFIIPNIFYSYSKKYYSQSLLLSTVVFCSMNFWRKPTYSLRRKLDIYISHVAFFLYLYQAIIYARNIRALFWLPNLAAIIYCFYMSNTCFSQKNEIWLKYHFLFHFLVGCQSLIVMDAMP